MKTSKHLEFESWQRKGDIGVLFKNEVNQLIIDRALKDILKAVNLLMDRVEKLENN